MSTSKRSYNSATRKKLALETRSKILEASRELFEAHGYEKVTIDSIAARARVAAPTVYALFQSKRGILRVLMDESLPSSMYETLLEEVDNAPSAKECLRVAAKMARSIYDAERHQIALFRGASLLSPEFQTLEAEREERRFLRQEDSVHKFMKKGEYKKGLPLSEIRDSLWALTGRDLYRLLVIERGWSPDHYEEWLFELLKRELL